MNSETHPQGLPLPWEKRASEPPSHERLMMLANFAAAALTGMLANCYANKFGMSFADYAVDAFKFAEAMLAELEKRAK